MINYIKDNLTFIVLIIFLIVVFYPKLSIKFNKNVKNVSGEEAEKLIKEKRTLLYLM